MAKIKVHELAKELSLESRDVVLRLKKMGFIAKNHMGQVDDKYAEQLRAEVGKGSSNAAFVPKVTRIKRSAVETDTLDTSSLDSPDAASTPIADESSKESTQHEEATTISLQTEGEPIVPDTNLASEELETPEVALSGKTSVLKPLEVKPKTEFQPNTPRPEYNRSRVTAQPNQGNVNTASKPAPSRQQSSYQRPSELSRRNTPSGYSPQGQRTSGQQDSRNSNQPAGGAYQGQRRPNQSSRPYNRGPENTDKDSDTQNTRTGKSQRPQQGKPAAPSVEKPSSTYRQEKKVFVKDVVFESSSMEEKERFFNRNPRGRGRRKKEVRREMPPVTPKKISIPEYIVIGDLAKTMGKSAGELIKKLFEMGTIATINQEIDADTAILLASEFGVTVEVQADKVAEFMEDFEDEDVFLVERPPIVTVMGHVDHGKTSLLDAIKKTNVIATEAGGITQHIGAYQVEINSKRITFLDTPGHEAFTAMRARGTQITDIAVLVVAADDGVMPQTIEAINHARAASVPIIVAINKMDKESANPERVKQELTTYGLVPEEWGGEDIMVSLSAKTGQGIETLLEMILLVAEVKELKANPKRQARGTVVEAELDKTRGPIATLLVQKGTLKIGDSILAGGVFGKVKALNDDKGKKVRSAGPSTPVEVLGFSGVPAAGEIFIAVKDDKDGRLVAYRQQSKKREEELHKTSKISLDDLFQKIAEGEIKELNLILKADVQGSVEAVSQAIQKLNTSEVKVKIIHAGVGAISESDIMLASASNAIIIGFNIRPDAKSVKAAEAEKVDIKLYRVIYDVTDDIKKAMGGLLKPTIKEVLQGHAEVRNVIKVPKVGMIAGSYVVDGKIVRDSLVRILRDSVVVFEGKIESLKRFKDDAKEVLSGFECGIGVEGFNDIKEGDVLESFILEEIRREL